MKEDLMFGHLGNGISICDRNREEYGDYKKVAHIDYNREITYYDKSLSGEAIHQIDYFGKYGNMSASHTQSYPVLKPVVFSKIDVQILKGIFQKVLKYKFDNIQIEVACFSDTDYITVLTTKEACTFLAEYYRYMKTEIKEGKYHYIFTMYDKANTNY